MKKVIVLLVLACLPVGILFSQAEGKKAAVQVSFFPPLSTQGMQASEYVNIVSLNLLAGVSKDVTAFSLSGLGMYTVNDIGGFHLSGLGTYAGNNGSGIMISGLFNKTNDFRGIQLAGLVNIAGRVKGLQLGILNIAEENDYPVGLVNIIKNGEMSVGVTYNETGSIIASFRSGGRILYGIIGLGVNHKAADEKLMAVGGLGGHIPVSSRFRINNELITSNVTFTDKENTHHVSFAVMPAFKLLPQWELFGGPSLNYLYTDNLDNKKMFPSHNLWKKHTNDKLQQLYLGFSVGTHFIF